MLRKLISVCLSVAMVMSFFATSAFANTEAVSEETIINVDLPFAAGTTREVVCGDYLIVVKDSINTRTRANGFYVSREFDVDDIIYPDDITYGTVYMEAEGTAVGAVAKVTASDVRVSWKPNHSDLKVTSKTLTGNNTSSAKLKGTCSFTADNGKATSVISYLYISEEL